MNAQQALDFLDLRIINDIHSYRLRSKDCPDTRDLLKAAEAELYNFRELVGDDTISLTALGELYWSLRHFASAIEVDTCCYQKEVLREKPRFGPSLVDLVRQHYRP